MQLKVQQSQRTGGIFGTKTIYRMVFHAEFTPAERDTIKRARLGMTTLFDPGQMPDAHLGKNFLMVVDNIDGSLLESPFVEELAEARRRITAACEELQARLDAEGGFDGSEQVINLGGAQRS